MATKLQIRNDSTDNWLSVNPILEKGEPGYETSTNKIKFGDGVTEWDKLPYLKVDSYDDTEIKEEINETKSSIEEKANAVDVYTKEEIEALKYIDEEELLSKNYMPKDEALTEFFTKTEINASLATKANVSELPSTSSLMNGQPPVVSDIDSSDITNIDELVTSINNLLQSLRQRGVIR